MIRKPATAGHAPVLCRWLSLFGLLLSVQSALAHPPGLSSVDVSLKPDGLVVKITFALQDIEAFVPMDGDLDAEVSDVERQAAKPALAKVLVDQLRIAVDGRDLVSAAPGVVDYDNQNNAHAEFRFQTVPKQSLLVQSKFLAVLAEGHQQYLTIHDQSDKPLAEKMLGKGDDSLQMVLPSLDGDRKPLGSSTFSAFVGFLKLGIEHIVTGYDHLLFLFALLVVTHSVWPAIKIITFFTIAHSITLALSGLNLIDLPSSFVEPFIAATIVYVAVENVIRGDHPKGRQWLTLGFGLVHGFGFAGVLRELDISNGDTGILLPLLSFNLGIEVGQVTVACLVLPMIWMLNNRVEIADKFLRGCSILVALMGVYWFLERTVL